MSEQGKFEEWALIEIFGHNRIAGLVSEAAIGGGSFVRVDVPEIELDGGRTIQAVTKYLGASSIFSITPMSKETAMKIAASLEVQPISTWDIREAVKQMKMALTGPDDPASHAESLGIGADERRPFDAFDDGDGSKS